MMASRGSPTSSSLCRKAAGRKSLSHTDEDEDEDEGNLTDVNESRDELESAVNSNTETELSACAHDQQRLSKEAFVAKYGSKEDPLDTNPSNAAAGAGGIAPDRVDGSTVHLQEAAAGSTSDDDENDDDESMAWKLNGSGIATLLHRNRPPSKDNGSAVLSAAETKDHGSAVLSAAETKDHGSAVLSAAETKDDGSAVLSAAETKDHGSAVLSAAETKDH
eukprot:g2486.t1